MTGWCNNYSGRSIHTESNDGVAFTIVSSEKCDEAKKGKTKEITCFHCEKVGHLSNKCEKEPPKAQLKKGKNKLITDNDSSDDENRKDSEDEKCTDTEEQKNDNDDESTKTEEDKNT